MSLQKKIIAIGGGEIGRPGYPVETIAIDKEIIKLSEKQNPKLLFLPTASLDFEGYVSVVKEHFGGRLSCQVDVLRLFSEPSLSEIEHKILSSDIVYVGGGNTRKMMKVWKDTGTDNVLKKAYESGIVLSGVSAGSICWFKYGNSDSKRFENDGDFEYIRVEGLGLINALHCPHYDAEVRRKPALKKMMKKQNVVGVAIDNCAAIEIIDDKYRIISSKNSANAYQVFWDGDRYEEEIIEKRDTFKFLSDIGIRNNINLR